jgi:hypothetical protein
MLKACYPDHTYVTTPGRGKRSMKVSEAEFRSLKKQNVIPQPCRSPMHKFRAQPSDEDGIRFASKKEQTYYRHLKMRVRNGEVLFFTRQTGFDLPGKVRHFLDFVEYWMDGTVHFVDVKGYDTPMGKLKRKQVEALYPITIEVK